MRPGAGNELQPQPAGAHSRLPVPLNLPDYLGCLRCDGGVTKVVGSLKRLIEMQMEAITQR